MAGLGGNSLRAVGTATLLAGFTSAANLAQTYLLDEYVNSTGARCLDGSPQRYWLQQSNSSTNSSKFYIHLMGGGWCESVADCANRAYNTHCYVGSSNPACFASEANPGNSLPNVSFSPVMDFSELPSCLAARWCGGLMINDAATNPLTWDWNKVLVPYCDGGSFGGDNDNVTFTTYNGATVPLYFRGRRNLDAVISDLIANHGLGDSTELLLSGDSAGGLATYWSADHIASRLSRTIVSAAPDSGFFFYDDTYPYWGQALTWVASAMNSTFSLNANCVDAQLANRRDPLQCAFPEVAAAFISTPLFVMNSRFDSALDSIVAGENGSNTTNVNRIGAKLLELVNTTVLNRPGNAAFITSCHEHCGQWAQGQKLGPGGQFDDFNVTIEGTQAIPALASWYTERVQRAHRQAAVGGDASTPIAAAEMETGGPDYSHVWVQSALFPCANCCAGGDGFAGGV